MVHVVQVAPEKYENSESRNGLPLPDTNHNSISYEIYQPVFFLGKVLGLISWYSGHPSFSHNENQLWRKAVNILYKFTSLLVFLILNTCKIMYFGNYKYDSQVTYFVDHASNAVELSYLLFVFGFCLCKENRLCILLQLTLGYDEVLKKTIKKGNFLFKHAALQLLFTILSMSSVPFTTGTDVSLIVNAAVTLNESYYFATNTFVAVVFVTAAYLCSECFSAVTSDLNKALISEVSGSNQDLQQLRLNYEQLYRLAGAVQHAFSWLITLELAQLAYFLCVNLYVLLVMQDFQLKTALAITVITSVYRTYTIAAAAGNITKQARSGLDSLHTVHIQNLSYAEGFQITTLSNMLSQSPVEITAAGDLFRVNMNTFTTIMATIMTYLIVLVQFRSPAPDLGIPWNTTKPNVTH